MFAKIKIFHMPAANPPAERSNTQVLL